MKTPSPFRRHSLRPRGWIFTWAAVAVVAGASCVNLTPPWQQGQPQDSGDVALASGGTPVPGSGGIDGGGAGGSGGLADVGPGNGEAAAAGGAGGAGTGGAIDGSQMGDDVPAAGGAGGSLDVGAPGTEVAATGGTGGTVDSGTMDDVPPDVPIGGAGGSVVDAPKDTPADGKGGTGGATTAKGGTTGTGGAGTGGKTGTGGAGTGGAGTGGAGTGGAGTGGATSADAGPLCTGYVGKDAGVLQGLVAYYPCESATGSLLPDQSGNVKNATLFTGTGGTGGYTFAAGKVGNALDLISASKGYATLPAGLLANACEATIATWVWVNTAVDWQRIFDFGKDVTAPTVYMFLTPQNGTTKKLRFAISITGNGTGEQIIDGTAALPTAAWHHVAVVLGPSGGILFLDGVQVGSNSAMTLRPKDLPSPPNYYLGRSQFAPDPYFDGNIDEFRVYDRALSPAEITTLANGT
jgi:hypothetical protein